MWVVLNCSVGRMGNPAPLPASRISHPGSCVQLPAFPSLVFLSMDLSEKQENGVHLLWLRWQHMMAPRPGRGDVMLVPMPRCSRHLSLVRILGRKIPNCFQSHLSPLASIHLLAETLTSSPPALTSLPESYACLHGSLAKLHGSSKQVLQKPVSKNRSSNQGLPLPQREAQGSDLKHLTVFHRAGPRPKLIAPEHLFPRTHPRPQP